MEKTVSQTVAIVDQLHIACVSNPGTYNSDKYERKQISNEIASMDVEESRVKRLEKQQSRYRDRGGYVSYNSTRAAWY